MSVSRPFYHGATVSWAECVSRKSARSLISLASKDVSMDLVSIKNIEVVAAKGLRDRLSQKLIIYPESGAEHHEHETYFQRLEVELEEITDHNLSRDFLVAADCVSWARSHSICCSPGRGAAPGSLVAYALGITDVDPVCHGLLFERFLNTESDETPRFFLDFCAERHEEVRDYARKTHGVNGEDGSIRHFLDYSPDRFMQSNQYEKELNKSRRVGDTFQYISGNIALTLIAHCQQIVRETINSAFDIGFVRDDDHDALAMAASGELNWIALLWGHDGLNSSDILYCLQQIKPESIEVLAAALVLSQIGKTFRHEERMVESFIEHKQGHASVCYPVPGLAKYLDDTFGTIIYQEQIMQIVCEVAAYSLREANRLRRILGRKDSHKIEREKKVFMEAARMNGVGNNYEIFKT